jgi:hypothetical protein
MEEIESQVAEETEPEVEGQVEEATTDEPTEHSEGAQEPEPTEETPEAAASEVSPEPSPPEQPVITPFSFAADGKRVEVEGASVVEHTGPDGKKVKSIVIPQDTFQRKMQPYLADRGKWAKTERDYQRKIADLSPDRNETVIRAQTILDEFDKVLSSEESLTQFLENFDRNREILRLKVENTATNAKLKAREAVEHESRTEQDTEATVQKVQADVPNIVRSAGDVIRADHGIEASPDALNAAYAEIMDNLPAYYRRATPQDAANYPNVTVGEIVRDDDKVLRTVYRFAYLMHAGSEQRTRTEEASKRNQAALGKTKTLPPSVPAKGAPAPGERKSEIKSFEDFKRVMGGHV